MNPITAADPESHSAEIVTENIDRLKELFPEAITEGKIDFAVLKQLLGGTVDERDEKYGLNWHGKRRARQLALMPSTGTLSPCPEESVDWDTTQNLMIEGDKIENDGDERLYFVVETKSTLFSDEYRYAESGKVRCAKRHFDALMIGESPARYEVASSADDLLGRVGA